MYKLILLLSATFHSANIEHMQIAAQNESVQRIAITARNTSVLIEENYAIGSGVLVNKTGDVYSVLTTRHVVNGVSPRRLRTFDGQFHKPIFISATKNYLDLAIIKFRSNRAYSVAKIGTSTEAVEGSTIYVAGFPRATIAIDGVVFSFRQGKLIANSTKPLSGGYSLIYSANTLVGMSGGGVFNDEGGLIGIHGKGDIDTTYKADDLNSNIQFKTSNSLGIAIERFVEVASEFKVNIEGKIATRLLDNIPTFADYFIAANEKSKKGDYLSAINQYDYVIEQNPRFVFAYNERAILKSERLNDESGALEDFNIAIKIDPKYANSYFNRGLLRMNNLNDKFGALEDFNMAIKINSEYANSYFSRGLLKMNKIKDYLGALQDLKIALNLYKEQREINKEKEVQFTINRLSIFLPK
jgi:tetratricopeptide (TPR) repeat protein